MCIKIAESEVLFEKSINALNQGKMTIPRLPRFGKIALSQFQLYIESQITTQSFVCRNFKILFLFELLQAKRFFFVSYTC